MPLTPIVIFSTVSFSLIMLQYKILKNEEFGYRYIYNVFVHVTVLTVSTVDLYSGMCNQHVYLQDFSRIHEKYKFFNELSLY